MKDAAAKSRFPRFTPVADMGVLVEFGERIDDTAHARVLAFDRALNAKPLQGFRESIPAYASVMVIYDALAVPLADLIARLRKLVDVPAGKASAPARREVEVCYDGAYGPDLAEVARNTGLTPAEVIEQHLKGVYKVYMFGFAPGYAYLGGVPEPIQVPRKPAPVRNIPAGAVLIAGPQCIVTTVVNPTGWSIIGRSPTPILVPDSPRPVAFEIGDEVRFRRIDAATCERKIALQAKAAP